jgi:hypothetical protein
MAAINSISIDLTKLNKEKIKDNRWLNLTVTINDETNQYGQNVSVFHSQSKEEREAKEKKEYVGNGKCVWNDGNIVNAEWIERVDNSQQNQEREEVDLF